MKLTIPEEILLLMLDDDTGRLLEGTVSVADMTMATAVIMELALAGKIDTDQDKLFVTAATPTGDAILDTVLAKIKLGQSDDRDSRYWVEALSEDAPAIRDQLLARLIEHGILHKQEGRFLWVFKERRYPTMRDKEEREVKARLLGVLLGDDIPEPRDALMIGLARAIDLFPHLLSSKELEKAQARIDQVAGLEELNRSLAQVLAEFYSKIAAQILPY